MTEKIIKTEDYFDKKSKGKYLTPENLANQIVKRVFELYKNFNENSSGKIPYICDPNVGEGVFLHSAYKYLSDYYSSHNIFSHLFGVDIEKDSIEKIKIETQEKYNSSFQLFNGNSLAPSSLLEFYTSFQTELINNDSKVYRFEPFNWNTVLNKLPKNGFDIIIGNPPWEVLRPNDKEFFSRFNPKFRKFSRIKQDEVKRELLKNPEIEEEYGYYCKFYKEFSSYVKKSGFYKLQGSLEGTRSWGTSINLYKMALEVSIRILAPNGILAMIVPASFLGELSASRIRKHILNKMSLLEVWSFPSEAKIFQNVDQNFIVLFLGNHTKEHKTTFVTYEISNKKDIDTYTCAVERKLLISASNKMYPFLNFKSKEEIILFENIIKHPTLNEPINGEILGEPTREVDETNHRKWFTELTSEVPLLKGRDIVQFGLNDSAPSKYIETEFINLHSNDWKLQRIGWRDIARPSSKRRLIASIIPQGFALGNSINYLKPTQSDDELYYLLAIFNSLVAEYRIRQLSTNSHINMFVMEQLNVPRLDKKSNLYKDIVSLSKLIYINKILSPLNEKRILLDYLVCCAYNLDDNNISTLCRSIPKLDENYDKLLLENKAAFIGV